ncbi:MAG: hypothetical protein AAFY06_16900, partial [Pseudomonadota bacterium]
MIMPMICSSLNLRFMVHPCLDGLLAPQWPDFRRIGQTAGNSAALIFIGFDTNERGAAVGGFDGIWIQRVFDHALRCGLSLDLIQKARG